MIKLLTRAACALPLALSGAALGAQDAIDLNPEGAAMTLDLAGPAGWAELFADTRVLALVQSKKFAELWAPAREAIDEVLAEANKEAPFDVQALYEGALTFSGRLRAVVLLEKQTDGLPAFAIALAAGPDGRTDLGKVCRDFEQLVVEQGTRKLHPLQIGGGAWLGLEDDGVTFTLPKMVGDRAVMVVHGPGGEALLARFFPSGEVRPAAQTDAAAECRMDARAVLDIVLPLILEQGDANGEEREALLNLMRTWFGAFRAFDLRLGKAGSHVEFLGSLAFEGDPGTFAGLLFPQRARPPELLAIVPRQYPVFSCQPIGLGLIPRLVDEVLAILPDQGLDWSTIDAMVEQSAGVRLSKDVLPHLGEELVVLSGVTDEALLEPDQFTSAFGPIDGLCIGLSLKSGAEFGRALETMLEHANLLRMRKTEKYRDADVHSVPLPMVGKLYWTVSDNLLTMGLGEQGLRNVHGLLDGAAAVARGENPADFPRAVAERLEVVPPSYCALSVASMTQQLVAFHSGFAAATEVSGRGHPALDDLGDAVAAVVEGLTALLREHRLVEVVTVSHHEHGRFVQRMIW